MQRTSNVVKNSPRLHLSGQSLDISQVSKVAKGSCDVELSQDESLLARMAESVSVVQRAVSEDRSIYGVTTGFGGMASQSVAKEAAINLQNNLISFLATGTGDEIDAVHVRAAMLLRANVLVTRLFRRPNGTGGAFDSVS